MNKGYLHTCTYPPHTQHMNIHMNTVVFTILCLEVVDFQFSAINFKPHFLISQAWAYMLKTERKLDMVKIL